MTFVLPRSKVVALMIVNFRLMDEEEDDAWLNWELVFNLVTAAIAVVLVFWLGGVGIKEL